MTDGVHTSQLAHSSMQSDDVLHCRLMMDEAHASKFTAMDLVVVDRTNPLDEDNPNALVDHAIAHCEGRDGQATLRFRFCLSEVAQAGSATAAARVARMRKLLRVPMTGWCAFWLEMRAETFCNLARKGVCEYRVARPRGARGAMGRRHCASAFPHLWWCKRAAPRRRHASREFASCCTCL